jgi:peptide/nickel transport system substrate-binding protein
MDAGSYWSKQLSQRLNRRRALQAGAGVTAAAAALSLIGCGGDDKESGISGLITQPVDRTKEAKKAGKITSATGEEGTSWDPTQSGTAYREYTHSALMREKAGVGGPTGEAEPDLATRWEVSPDKLQITFKINKNAHFAPQPPTNGRAVDIDDVKMSFDYYEKKGNRAADLFASVVPSAPITSVTAVDSETLVLKLHSPDVIVMDALTSTTYPVIMPKEGLTGQFNVNEFPRGSGPYYVFRHEPSAFTEFRVNPGYHLNPPFAPEWQVFYLKEYAAQAAQFRSGQLLIMNPADIRKPDILPMKREVPALQLFREEMEAEQGHWFFGYLDNPINIFRDVRVRQAASMAFDRDLWIDTFHDVSAFAKEGLSLNTCWGVNSMSCNVQGDWLLDPRNQIKGREMGENAKYFKHDIAEAKKLVAAAGYTSGAKTEYHGVLTADYGAQFPRMNEVLITMIAEAGINASIHGEEYRGSFRNAYRDTRGRFAGFSAGRTSLDNYDDPTQRMVAQYHKDGDLFRGIDPNGKDGTAGDPVLDELAVKMRREFDMEKRQQIGYEIQRYDAKQNYYIRFPGGADLFSLAWPALANWSVYKGGYPWFYYWLDQEKAPFKMS